METSNAQFGSMISEILRARGYEAAAKKFIRSNFLNACEATILTSEKTENGDRVFYTNTGHSIRVSHNTADGTYLAKAYINTDDPADMEPLPQAKLPKSYEAHREYPECTLDELDEAINGVPGAIHIFHKHIRDMVQRAAAGNTMHGFLSCELDGVQHTYELQVQADQNGCTPNRYNVTLHGTYTATPVRPEPTAEPRADAAQMIPTEGADNDPNAPAEIALLTPADASEAKRDFGGTPIPPRNPERRTNNETLKTA